MFNNINSALKLKLLGGGFLLMLVLAYFLSIRDTITLAGECKQKEQNLAKYKELNGSIQSLSLEAKKIDELIGSQPDTSHKVIDLLLDNVTEYCNDGNCIIKEIPASAKVTNNGYEVETYFLTIEGSFKKLLDLVYLLEQKKKTGGHVASLQFSLNKNNNTKRQELLLTIFIQHYNKI
ncbi:MAG: hypothetical protein ACXVNM_07205 [Bacteroidia bacterium]